MKIAKDTEDKIKKLQLFEQNMQTLGMQKQQYNGQLMEVESALNELEKAENAYKIVGNIMVKKEKASMKEELEQKKEMLSIRVRTLDKQEENVRRKSSELQKEVLVEMKDETT
ncbi:MAG: prefoldin subunit beta [Candidatus Woesearchaeota archaeon]